MDYKRFLIYILETGIALLLLSACGTAQPILTPTTTALPTLTPEPTVTPAPPTAKSTPETPQWEYVALGDRPVMIYGDYSYVPHYAALIEEDLGVMVNVHIIGSDLLTTEQLLEKLRNDEKLRVQISNADVVTLAIGDIEGAVYLEGSCYKAEDVPDCMAKEFESTFRVNYSAILDELLMQSQPGAIIRTMTLYVRDVEVPGYDGDERPFMKLLNTHILEVASEHNIPVARVDVAFSGLSIDEDPVANGFLDKEGYFPTLAGAVKIAEVHRDLGYEPAVP